MTERRQNARRSVCYPGRHSYELVQMIDDDHCRVECEWCGEERAMLIERRAEWDDRLERLFTEEGRIGRFDREDDAISVTEAP